MDMTGCSVLLADRTGVGDVLKWQAACARKFAADAHAHRPKRLERWAPVDTVAPGATANPISLRPSTSPACQPRLHALR